MEPKPQGKPPLCVMSSIWPFRGCVHVSLQSENAKPHSASVTCLCWIQEFIRKQLTSTVKRKQRESWSDLTSEKNQCVLDIYMCGFTESENIFLTSVSQANCNRASSVLESTSIFWGCAAICLAFNSAHSKVHFKSYPLTRQRIAEVATKASVTLELLPVNTKER